MYKPIANFTHEFSAGYIMNRLFKAIYNLLTFNPNGETQISINKVLSDGLGVFQ